jgi:hypothetical protein
MEVHLRSTCSNDAAVAGVSSIGPASCAWRTHHLLEPVAALKAAITAEEVVKGGRRIEFGTFADLEMLPEPPMLWEGFLPCPSFVILSGDAKAGKSTMLAGVLKAIERGEPFLGRQTSQATAVWLSEEPEQTLRAKAEMFGLFKLESSIVGASGVAGIGWENLVAQATEHALNKHHKLLIVDTFIGLARLRGEDENHAGAVAERMEPLRVAASHGLAVVLVHHTSKNGGKSPRGSGALTGMPDVSILFHRKSKKNPQFTLTADSRFPSLTPLQVHGTLDYTAAGASYHLAEGGSMTSGSKAEDSRSLLLAALETHPGLTYADFEHVSGLSRHKAKRHLPEMRTEGIVKPQGNGTKGDSYHWFVA